MKNRLGLNEALFESATSATARDKESVFIDNKTGKTYIIDGNTFKEVKGGDGPSDPPKDPPTDPPVPKDSPKDPPKDPPTTLPGDPPLDPPEEEDPPTEPPMDPPTDPPIDDPPEEEEEEEEEEPIDPLKRPGVIVHNKKDNRDYVWDPVKNKYVRWL